MVVSGFEKHVWERCKAALQLLDPNWGEKGFDYGGWFTLSNFRKGMNRVQFRCGWTRCIVLGRTSLFWILEAC